MRLQIHTKVSAEWQEVKKGFTEKLFLALNPPFPKVKLLQFDGCREGDIVSIELGFLLFKQNWISEVMDDGGTHDCWHFTDVGTALPFFLKSWRHTHTVKACDQGSSIIDDIHFTTGTQLTDAIFYPVLYLQFLYRRPTYQKVFGIKKPQ